MPAVPAFQVSARWLAAMLVVVAMCAPTGLAWAESSPAAGAVSVAQARSGDNAPATLGDLRQTEGRMNEKFEGLRAQVEAQGRQLDAQGRQLDEQGRRLDEQRRRMENLEMQVVELQGGVAELRAEVRGQNRELSEMRSDIRALNNTLLAIFATLLGGCLVMVLTVMVKRRELTRTAAVALLPLALPMVALIYVLAADHDAFAAGERENARVICEQAGRKGAEARLEIEAPRCSRPPPPPRRYRSRRCAPVSCSTFAATSSTERWVTSMNGMSAA